jgi:putative tryptophan/tyrosine transport system substrate-binding protein
MRRREFITLLGGAAATTAWPVATRAQRTAKVPRVGVLWHGGSAEQEKIPLSALREGLSQLGYVDGQNIILENRFPNEEPERFQSLAIELAQLKVDVLVAITRQAALAVQSATTTIPIIFNSVADPIESNLVSSLPRPGGNITGISNMAVELTPKRVALLKEAVVGLSSVALLINGNYEIGVRRNTEAAQSAAAHLGITVRPIEIRTVADFEPAFSLISKSRLQGVVLTVDGLFYANQKRLAELALQHSLPMMAYAKEMSEAGALMSYGPDIPAIYRRTAGYVVKILKGAKPADLPVEQPTTFDFFVNEETAKSLRLTIPPSVLIQVGFVNE